MQVPFTAMQTLSRHFLLLPTGEVPCAQSALRLLGRQSGVRAEGLVLYECERLADGTCLFGAEEYTAFGERVPLSADGARTLGAYLQGREEACAKTVRILSSGEIKSVSLQEEVDGTRHFAVRLPPPAFDADRVGLRAASPLLGQKIPLGTASLPFYALALGARAFAVCFRFGTSLAELRPASIALPLSVKHIFSRPFEAVFAEITGEDSFSLRVFSLENGELEASSEGAASAVSVAYLLGLLPVGCDIHATMRGGKMCVRADAVGAPILTTATVKKKFAGILKNQTKKALDNFSLEIYNKNEPYM